MLMSKTIAAALAVVLAGSVTTTTRADVPDVVRHIPAAYELAVVIPDLSRASRNVAMLNRRLGLNQPQMNDVLTLAKAVSGVMGGLDDAGGAALVFTKLRAPDSAGRGGMPATDGVLLLPVTDFGAFLANYGLEPDGAGAQPIEMLGRRAFVARRGAYALLGVDRDVVATFPPGDGRFGESVGRFGRHVIERSDISIHVNVRRLGPEVVRAMNQQYQMMVSRARRRVGGAGEMADVLETTMGLYRGWTERLLNSGEVAVTGIDLAPAGAGFTFVLKFRDERALGGALAGVPGHSTSLDRLPGGPYVMASSVDAGALPLAQWIDDIAAAFGADSPWSALLQRGRTLAALSGQCQTLLVANPAALPGPEAVGGVYVIKTADPKAWVTAWRGLVEDLDGLDLGGVSYRARFEPAATTVHGHAVDRYEIALDVSDELKRDLGATTFQAQQGVVAAVDGAVVIGLNRDAGTIGAVLDTAAEGAAALDADPGIVAVRAHLPGRRVGETYLNVGALLGIVGTMMPAAVPGTFGHLPPVAAAATTGDGSFAVRGFLPMEVVQAARDVAGGALHMRGDPVAAAPAGHEAH